MARNEPLDLTVTIRYYGPKASNFYFSNPTGWKMLKEDLLALKLPHPKQDNVIFKRLPNGRSECLFVWPSAAWKGTLHTQLTSKILPLHEQSETYKRSLDDLSIGHISLQGSRPIIFSSSPKKHPVRQPIPATPLQFPHKQWRRSDYTSSSQSGSSTNNLNEAQQLLDDMATALRIPKVEPVESTIPEPIIRDDSVASSRAPTPAKPIKTSGSDIGTPMSIASSMPASPVLQPTVMETLPVPPLQISPASAPSPPSIEPPSPASAPVQALAFEDCDNTPPPGLTISTKTHLPSPTRTSRKRNHSPEPSDTHPRLRPAPHPNDIPTIQKLTRELWDLRRQVTAGVARETAILNELRSLNSAFLPEVSTVIRAGEDFATKTRLQMVERELQEETKLRVQAEAMLTDIQRECREPFVVPALFEAFAVISKITNEAVNS